MIAARITARIHEQTGKRFYLSDFYRSPTIAALADIVEEMPPSAYFNIHDASYNYKSWLPLHDFQLTFGYLVPLLPRSKS